MKIIIMSKQIYLVFFMIVLSSCNTYRNKRSSLEIENKFNIVERMAEDLIRTGFTAGEGYGEIWIRDFNSFIELATKVHGKEKITSILEMFFKFQGDDGNIPDGYIPIENANISYKYISSNLAEDFLAHKNTVETDQETSLIQAIYRYVMFTGDNQFLNKSIAGKTVMNRMDDALQYLMDFRFNREYGLLWGGTTIDWGDVQPEHEWGVELDDSSHPAIDIYDNAMFVIALNNYLDLIDDENRQLHWLEIREKIQSNIRKYLWESDKQKFKPHVYLEKGSPFPNDFNEDEIYYHGGTYTAIEAGLLNLDEIKNVYKIIQNNVDKIGAQSIGLAIYPAYPEGTFKNPILKEYQYHNGGDWTWFGARMVQQLIQYKLYEEAYEAVSPMLDFVIDHNDFYEWWTLDGAPGGSGNYRGTAGVLWKSIQMFKDIK